MLSFVALALATIELPACTGATTPEVNTCLERRSKASDAVLDRYFQAALRRARENGNETAQHLLQAQQSWTAYRAAECGSVSDYWRGGTIRLSRALECRIRLDQLRTYAIWREWLTYPDSTPPILPRPDVESATADR